MVTKFIKDEVESSIDDTDVDDDVDDVGDGDDKFIGFRLNKHDLMKYLVEDKANFWHTISPILKE